MNEAFDPRAFPDRDSCTAPLSTNRILNSRSMSRPEFPTEWSAEKIPSGAGIQRGEIPGRILKIACPMTFHLQNRHAPEPRQILNWRRDRDSNPGTLTRQRFSRPPQSTTLPPLRSAGKPCVLPGFRDFKPLALTIEIPIERTNPSHVFIQETREPITENGYLGICQLTSRAHGIKLDRVQKGAVCLTHD